MLKSFLNVLFAGRKFPIKHLVNVMNESQSQYMRLFPDEFYERMSIETRNFEFDRIEEERETVVELKKFQRQRTIACWHDSSGISNSSHLLITFCAVYDKAIYLSNQEYFEKTGIKLL